MSRAYISRRGGSGGEALVPVTIVLETSGGTGSCIGCQVTVYDLDLEGIEIDSFTYAGPRTLRLPYRTHGRVRVGELQGYLTPTDVDFVARNEGENIVKVTYVHGTRLGYVREKGVSDPDARITYLFDAVGRQPMHVDLATGTPEYGDWKPTIDQIVRPVMLWTDGTVAYELDHDDQTKRIDGTASDVANAAFEGNAMVEFSGKYKWVKRYQDDAAEYVIFSNVQYENDYHAYAHTNASGAVKDAFYWGMYEGTYSNSKLRSIGAGNVMVSQTRQTEINRAVANGDGYYTIYKSGWDYIADLLTLIGKNDNSQAVYGYGRCKSGNTSILAAGTLKNKGAFWGSINKTSDVKALYIEGPWGNIWEGMAGCIFDQTNGIKVKMTPPYNLTGEGYEATGVVPSGKSGGYVDTEDVTELGYVPKTANGSETTYTCDGLWFITSQVDYAIVGGCYTDEVRPGSRCLALNTLESGTHKAFGSRLSYIPT